MKELCTIWSALVATTMAVRAVLTATPAECGYVDIAVLPDDSLGIIYESDIFRRIRFVKVPDAEL